MNAKWIPCKDYLPPIYEQKLVQLDNGALFMGFTILNSHGDYVWRAITDHIAINVVAWMDLPERYKGE